MEQTSKGWWHVSGMWWNASNGQCAVLLKEADNGPALYGEGSTFEEACEAAKDQIEPEVEEGGDAVRER